MFSIIVTSRMKIPRHANQESVKSVKKVYTKEILMLNTNGSQGLLCTDCNDFYHFSK